MLKLCSRWQTENIQAFSPKMQATQDFLDHTSAILSRTVWAGECRSWYKNHSTDPLALALWPGSSLHYIEAISKVRYEDWDIAYKGNRFAWLGNGFSQTESDPTCDWAYYIRNSDESPYLSKAKEREIETASGSRDPAKSIAGLGQLM